MGGTSRLGNVTAGSITASGATNLVPSATAVVVGNPQAVTVTGCDPATHEAWAVLASDDTGGTLGDILGCTITAADTVTVLFENAPSNSDGVVRAFVNRVS